MVTIDSYNSHKQKLFGVLNIFYEYKEVLRLKSLRIAGLHGSLKSRPERYTGWSLQYHLQ